MAELNILLLPGWQNSGPAHWQSHWERQFGYQRVEQHDWMRPLRGDWLARLQDVVLALEQDRAPDAPPRIVLAAHSLGCQLVASWAASSGLAHRIKASLLVAPGDTQCPELASVLHSWSPPALRKLPFPSQLLSSRDDPYCSFSRARLFADAWGAQFVDCGKLGHINSDSDLGDWPAGHARLLNLCQAGGAMPTTTVSPAQPQRRSTQT